MLATVPPLNAPLLQKTNRHSGERLGSSASTGTRVTNIAAFYWLFFSLILKTQRDRVTETPEERPSPRRCSLGRASLDREFCAVVNPYLLQPK